MLKFMINFSRTQLSRLHCSAKQKKRKIINQTQYKNLANCFGPICIRQHVKHIIVIRHRKLLYLPDLRVVQFIKQINQYKIPTTWNGPRKKKYFHLSWSNQRSSRKGAFFLRLILYTFIFTYLYLRPQNMQRITSQPYKLLHVISKKLYIFYMYIYACFV